jgi:hypothetical protein
MRGGKTAVARRARSKAGAKGEECVGKRRPPRATSNRAIAVPCVTTSRQLRFAAPDRVGSDAPRH